MKPEETRLESLLQTVKDDYGPDWNQPVRVLFQRILDNHWNEVKDTLKQEIERLAEISTWPDVEEFVKERELQQLEVNVAIDKLIEAHSDHNLDAMFFVADVLENPQRALMPRR